jgi:hypothetical protein
LCDLTNETLEGELPDEELSRFLVTTNFTEGDGSGAETMGLLDTASSVLEYESAMTRVKIRWYPRQSYVPMTWQRVVYGELCLKTNSDERANSNK